MGFQTPINLKEAGEAIHENRFLLPSIQRELVWDEDRIEKLFDSLIRDYPIGSFLFWRVPVERVNDFQFYEFMRRFHERNFKHNPKANVVGVSEITAVLDGQQRLTAFTSDSGELMHVNFDGSDSPTRKLTRRKNCILTLQAH